MTDTQLAKLSTEERNLYLDQLTDEAAANRDDDREADDTAWQLAQNRYEAQLFG